MQTATTPTVPSIPAGKYMCKPRSWGLSKARDAAGNTKFTRFVVHLSIMEGAYQGQIIEYSGGLEGQGLEYTIRSLEAMGLDPDNAEAIASPHTLVLDRTVRATFVHEAARDNSGKVYGRVKYVDGLRGNDRLTASEASDLKRRIAALRGGPVAAEPAAFAEEAPIGEDPFA
jgi:hypothetical protein